MSEDQDWRLRAELDADPTRSRLDDLVGHARGPDVAKDVGGAVPHDVVITHNGKLLFAYAASEAALTAARAAIEGALTHDGINASIYLSHWDDERDEWRQTDPPLTGDEALIEAAAERDAEAVETRTMVASTGKLIRTEVEQIVLNWADKLNLECTIVEHPHMLTTQIAFTVTGPRHKVDEFADGLKAEEVATMRTEREVMISPL